MEVIIMARTWMITGVSSGFGNEMARQLLEKGETVIGTVRNTRKVEALIATNLTGSYSYD